MSKKYKLEQPIPCLSIRPPYPDLIMAEYKWCENRSWKTSYRGPLLIHASQTIDGRTCKEFGIVQPKQSAIVGMVTLLDCVERKSKHATAISRNLRSVLNSHGYDPDRSTFWEQVEQYSKFHWLFVDPITLEKPVPCGGQLNLWMPDKAILDQIVF